MKLTDDERAQISDAWDDGVDYAYRVFERLLIARTQPSAPAQTTVDGALASLAERIGGIASTQGYLPKGFVLELIREHRAALAQDRKADR